MSDGVDFLRMRDAVRTSGVEWQRHALERMVERSIRRADVLEVVRSGEPIEIYPADSPFPSALILGWIGTRPLHVVAAFDPERDRVFVITAYEPDLQHFEPGFRVRRTL